MSSKRGASQAAPVPMNPMRWMLLAASVLLIAFSFLLRMRMSFLPAETSVASDVFGKVGILFLCIWLAWPAVELLWNTPSGFTLAAAVVVTGVLFVYRPKTILFTGPFLAAGFLFAILANWVRKKSK